MKSKAVLWINISGVIILGTVISYLNRNFLLDDALIYYRYIENFLNGSGLVYNIDDRFNALTSPLYVYISILLSSVTREIIVTQVILNGIFIISAALLLMSIFREQGKIVLSLISSLILVSAKFFYLSLGLETNLFVFMSLACIYFFLNKKFHLMFICSALLYLTRGEGIFLVFILAYFVLRGYRKDIKLSYAIVPVLILAVNFGFNMLYYGDPLPHTLSAKIAQGRSGLWGHYGFMLNITYLADMFNKQAFYMLMLFSFALIGLIKFYKEKLVTIFLLYTFLLTVFYLALNIPSYHWYYSIHFVTLYVLASFGIMKVLEIMKQKIRRPALLYSSIVLLFAYPVLTHAEIARLVSHQEENTDYRKIGEWIRNNSSPDAKVGAVEIGHIGWYSKRYIIDILGLANRKNAEFLANGELDKWIYLNKPDIILIHDPPWPQEVRVPDFVRDGYYAEDNTLNVKGFKIVKATGKKL